MNRAICDDREIFICSIGMGSVFRYYLPFFKDGERAVDRAFGATGRVVRGVGCRAEVSRDLRESPYPMDLDLSSVPDGTYELRAQVFDGTKSLGAPLLRFVVPKDLNDAISRLEVGAKAAPESVRAEVLYPVVHLHTINRGLMDIGMFDAGKEPATAAKVLSASKDGKDPFAGQTGDSNATTS